jgi:dihydrofolate reductase
MLTDGLVDELHLFVFPWTLGSGERLFADGGAKTKFTLAETRTCTRSLKRTPPSKR